MKKYFNNKIIVQALFVLFLVILPVLFTFAEGEFANPLKSKNLESLVNSLIDAAIDIGAVVAVMAFIYTGFLFVTANGEEKKIEKAKRSLQWSAIGALVLLGAKVISEVIQNAVDKIKAGS
ncbi:MAG: pilin [Magnetococcus sp. WYHC-3]